MQNVKRDKSQMENSKQLKVKGQEIKWQKVETAKSQALAPSIETELPRATARVAAVGKLIEILYT